MSIQEFPDLLHQHNDEVADALRHLQKAEVANASELNVWDIWS